MKTQHFFLTLALFFSFCITAQDKYEFMIIEYSVFNKGLTVSIDGVSFSRQEIDLPKTETAGNATPLLKKMKEYQASGWEVMNLDCQMLGAGEVYFSYLRKKKAEQK